MRATPFNNYATLAIDFMDADTGEILDTRKSRNYDSARRFIGRWLDNQIFKSVSYKFHDDTIEVWINF